MTRPHGPIRRTIAAIDQHALAHNVALARQLSPGQAICAVVKANAYGHGAVPMALALQALQVECFGVAFVEEAVPLREAGVTRPILVWGSAYDGAFDAIVKKQLTPVLGHIDQLHAFAQLARKSGVRLACHLEVDTGMARLGLDFAALPTFLAAAKRCAAEIKITGVMSHLALADRPQDPFNTLQAARFAAVQACVAQAGLSDLTWHLANSPATCAQRSHAPPTQMVRCGLLLYGMQPLRGDGQLPLAPVMQLRTTIVALRELPPNTRVSYGGRFSTPGPGPSRIATISIGYGDGYRRDFSGRAAVLVHGQRAPVVGTVCMDMCMVDVTAVKDAAVGDAVIVMGSQGKESIRAEELATWASTINYEIVCGIAARVPRIYTS